MKKPTVEEWMAYHTEMHILAKAAHNPLEHITNLDLLNDTKAAHNPLEHITNLDLLNDTKEETK